jgi:predicted  nucleic acid-binding Zn-ribbon protein
MFKTKENFAELKEDIAKLASSIQALNQRMDGIEENHRTGFNTVVDQIQQLESNKESALSEFKDALSDINKLKNKLETNINALILIKDNIKNNLIDDMKKEIEKEVKAINDETVKYFELKKDINEASNILLDFKGHVVKLNQISEQIKSADFQLGKYYKNIEDSNAEKLKLMQEVDKMRGLVSRERRKNR